jgi:hypothetical protein
MTSRPASDDLGSVIYCQFLTSQVTGLPDHARPMAGDTGHAIRVARRHITRPAATPPLSSPDASSPQPAGIVRSMY